MSDIQPLILRQRFGQEANTNVVELVEFAIEALIRKLETDRVYKNLGSSDYQFGLALLKNIDFLYKHIVHGNGTSFGGENILSDELRAEKVIDSIASIKRIIKSTLAQEEAGEREMSNTTVGISALALELSELTVDYLNEDNVRPLVSPLTQRSGLIRRLG